MTQKHKTIKASSWVLFGHLFSQLVRFGGNLVLTRLLVPEMFGVMAIVNVFVMGVKMLSDLGLGQSIIQHNQGGEPAFVNTAWTLQVIRGFVVWIVICIAAFFLWLANYFGYIAVGQVYADPLLPWLLVMVGVSAVISGFNSTAIFQANRSLNLGRLTINNLIAQSVGLVTIITIAWIEKTIWAIPVGGLVASFVDMLLSHCLPGIKNKFCWDKSALVALIKFGKWIFLSTAIGFVANQGDRLILGGLLSPSMMGVFSIAFMLSSLPATMISALSHKVLFPNFSRAHREKPAELKKILIRSKFWLSAIAMPLTGILMVLSSTIIDILYDDRYTEAGWIMALLLLRGASGCMLIPSSIVLMAKGEPQYSTISAAFKAVFILIAVPLSFLHYGFEVMILVIGLSDLINIPILWFGLIKYKLFDIKIEMYSLLMLFLGYQLGLIILKVFSMGSWFG